MLESAIETPFQVFGGEELYPTIQAKGTRLGYGLIKNHCMLDGNKRIGTHAMLVFFALNGIELRYTQKELYERVLSVADGRKKKSIALIIILLTIVVIFICGRYYFAHNKSYKNEAIEKGDYIYLNGVRYSQTSKLENYKISNVVICTSDSGRKLYEIEEYPDYEYIAGYYAWDGVIYKKDETD